MPSRKPARHEPLRSETGWNVIESVRPIAFRIERNGLILRSEAPAGTQIRLRTLGCEIDALEQPAGREAWRSVM